VRVFAEQVCRRLSEIVNESLSNPTDIDQSKLRLVDEDFDHFLDKEFEMITDHKS
jgi:hypothetical protein